MVFGIFLFSLGAVFSVQLADFGFGNVTNNLVYAGLLALGAGLIAYTIFG